jgi:hypothetical protein
MPLLKKHHIDRPHGDRSLPRVPRHGDLVRAGPHAQPSPVSQLTDHQLLAVEVLPQGDLRGRRRSHHRLRTFHSWFDCGERPFTSGGERRISGRIAKPFGGGVIGNTTGSGPVIQGSSPCPRANETSPSGVRTLGLRSTFMVPSSSGLGHHPLKVEARVRIPLGLQVLDFRRLKRDWRCLFLTIRKTRSFPEFSSYSKKCFRNYHQGQGMAGYPSSPASAPIAQSWSCESSR